MGPNSYALWFCAPPACIVFIIAVYVSLRLMWQRRGSTEKPAVIVLPDGVSVEEQLQRTIMQLNAVDREIVALESERAILIRQVAYLSEAR